MKILWRGIYASLLYCGVFICRYRKIIIIKNTKYLDEKTAIIDKDEFKETIKFFEIIKKEALEYVEDYVAYVKNEKNTHIREFERRYSFSTLKYFHDELGI